MVSAASNGSANRGDDPAELTHPPGLSVQAVKAARRLQGLPNGRLFVIYLIKGRKWSLAIQNAHGAQVEEITKGG